PETVVVPETPVAHAAPAASPPRGRFMDMVRPPARNARAMSSSPASRQGATLQPMGTLEIEDTAELAAQSEVAQQPISTIAQSDSSNGLDLMNMTLEQPESHVDDVAPLISPFLPDAKVEKRPLGRPSDAAPAVDLAAELGESSEVEPAASEEPVAPFEDTVSP